MLKKLLLASVLFTAAAPAFSSIVISGTRIVFPGDKNEVNVRTINKGDKAALAQVWADDGDMNVNIQNAKVPFIITPPVFRVEPNKGQSIRLIYNGMALPQDKESMFWFNLLEIPPKPASADNGQKLELAFRTRIKIFYRPKSLLDGSPTTEVDKLQWQLVSDATHGAGIKVTNPSPYYFSFNSVDLYSGNKRVTLNSDTLAPKEERTFYPAEKEKLSSSAVTAMSFQYLNDYGGAVLIKQKLSGNAFVKEKSTP